MDPITVGAIGQIGGGIVGGLLGRRDAKRKREMQRRAIEQLLATEEEAGRAHILGDANDAGLEGRQLQTIDTLRGVYEAGGMDSQSRADLQQAQASNAAREKGARGAIAQNAAMRGVSGSGAEIASQLANQQGAANRNAMAGTQAAGDARARAIQSLMGGAQIAGQARGQGMQRAGQVDQLAEFNAGQRLRKAGMLSGVYTGQAQGAQDDEDRRRNQFGGLGEAVAGIGSGKGWW